MPRSLLHTSPVAELVLRPARYSDEARLERLAALDSRRPLRGGQVLVAEIGGRIVAAISTHDGRTIADPFSPSADAVDLLRRHAAGSRPARARARRRLRLPRLELGGAVATA